MDAAIQVEVEGYIADFRWNDLELRQLLVDDVGKDLARRAIRVESRAKQYATGTGGGPNVRTGRLRGSITWTLGKDLEGVYADIGSAVHYAPFVELGTTLMQARPFLRPALDAARGDL